MSHIKIVSAPRCAILVCIFILRTLMMVAFFVAYKFCFLGERVKITLISMNEKDSCVCVCVWLKKPAWHTHTHTHTHRRLRVAYVILFCSLTEIAACKRDSNTAELVSVYLFLLLFFTMLPNFGILIQKSVFYLIRWTHVCGAFYLISLFLFALRFCFVSLFLFLARKLNELKSWSIYDTASVSSISFWHLL